MFQAKLSKIFFLRNFGKKYWTHHEQKNVYDVSNLFICDFVRNEFYKASWSPANLKKPYAARITCLLPQ